MVRPIGIMHTISVGVRPVNRASPIPNEYMNGLLFETTHSGISGILLQNDPGCRGTHRVSHIRLAETKRFNSDQILHAMRAGPGSSDVEPGSSSTRWSREDAGAASNAGGSCSSPSFSQGAANGPRDGKRRMDEMRIRARSCVPGIGGKWSAPSPFAARYRFGANVRPRAASAAHNCLMAFGPMPWSRLTSASLSWATCREQSPPSRRRERARQIVLVQSTRRSVCHKYARIRSNYSFVTILRRAPWACSGEI